LRSIFDQCRNEDVDLHKAMSGRATRVAPGIEQGGHCALSAMLTVSQLSKSFAGRALFDDVSLQVNRGDLIKSQSRSIDTSSSVLTFLPYGSDNYFSSDEKARRVDRTGRRANGRVQGQFIRSHLEQARAGDRKSRKFMRLAGSVRGGPRDLSQRNGFSTK
jgi:hypothetical protein